MPRTCLLIGLTSLALALGATGCHAGEDEPPVDDTALEALLADLPPPSAGSLLPESPGLSRVTSWRSSLEAFAESDRLHAPAPGGVVFVGSSSIRMWDSLDRAFPGVQVVRRGFGGSLLADCSHYADRLVLPYKPSLVVVYAGDNDLAAGASPEAVLASFASLVSQVHAALPTTRIAFISIKPSPARLALMPTIARTNALIATHARSDRRLDFIDIHTPMLDRGGQPRVELFREDGLHPSAAGYAVWQGVIAPYLQRAPEMVAAGLPQLPTSRPAIAKTPTRRQP